MQLPLIGRTDLKRKLDEHAAWLSEDNRDDTFRVVTLYGLPGIGKTRMLTELYESVYAKCHKVKGADGGLNYSERLQDHGNPGSFSAALNPEVGADMPRAGFYWFGLRFDNPAYRQYRAVSMNDMVQVFYDQWLGERAKTAGLARESLLEAVLDHLRTFVTGGHTSAAVFAILKILYEWREIGHEHGHAGSKHMRAAAAQKIAKLFVALTFDAPLVIVLDNAHWAIEGDAAAPDLEAVRTLFGFLNEGKKPDFSELMKKEKSWLGPLKNLLERKRHRCLVVMTFNSSAYAPMVSRARSAPELQHENAESASNASMAAEDPAFWLFRKSDFGSRHDYRLPALNEQEGKDLLRHGLESFGVQPGQSSDRDMSLSQAEGTPLRILEIARRVAQGLPLEGPLESESLYWMQAEELVAEPTVSRDIKFCAARLALDTGRFSIDVLAHCLRMPLETLLPDLKRLEELGAVRDEGRGIWSFTHSPLPEYVLQICGGRDGLAGALRVLWEREPWFSEHLKDAVVAWLRRGGELLSPSDWDGAGALGLPTPLPEEEGLALLRLLADGIRDTFGRRSELLGEADELWEVIESKDQGAFGFDPNDPIDVGLVGPERQRFLSTFKGVIRDAYEPSSHLGLGYLLKNDFLLDLKRCINVSFQPAPDSPSEQTKELEQTKERLYAWLARRVQYVNKSLSEDDGALWAFCIATAGNRAIARAQTRVALSLWDAHAPGLADCCHFFHEKGPDGRVEGNQAWQLNAWASLSELSFEILRIRQGLRGGFGNRFMPIGEAYRLLSMVKDIASYVELASGDKPNPKEAIRAAIAYVRHWRAFVLPDIGLDWDNWSLRLGDLLAPVTMVENGSLQWRRADTFGEFALKKLVLLPVDTLDDNSRVFITELLSSSEMCDYLKRWIGVEVDSFSAARKALDPKDKWGHAV